MGPDVIGREPAPRRWPAASVAPLRWRRGERRLAAAAAAVAAAGALLLATGAVDPVADAPGSGPARTGDLPAVPLADAGGQLIAGGGGALGPPPRPDLAVRPIGGMTTRTAAGARGTVDLEVRNALRPVTLLSIGAEVPGVAFSVVIPPNGTILGTDGRVALRLDFVIADCARLRRTGRIVLRVDEDGRPAELGLTITNDEEAGTLRQVVLDRVLHACD